MKGKLIVIEGTDCSGKETQTNLVMKKLNEKGKIIVKFSFPNYESPTGKIIGGPYLGKKYISSSWFLEGASKVDPKVASLYYAADRYYNVKEIEDYLKKGYHVILDRYTYSNMGHQGGKLNHENDRLEMYKWIEQLEFELLGLPRPDLGIFLHLPYEYALKLKEDREEQPDGHEVSEKHLKDAERAYLEIAKKYHFKTIKCYKNNKIKTIEEINQELYNYLIKELKP